MMKKLQFGITLILLMAMGVVAMAQMPAAISIEPANATGWDDLTLTLDVSAACVPDGKQGVDLAPEVRMHSAAFLYSNIDNWGSAWGDPGIDYDAKPLQDGFDFPTLTDNGDGTYSITFNPAQFYGVEEGATIIGITAVFNGGSWDYEGKDVGDDGCQDFYIPLNYTAPTPALKFKLDLTYQEELGNFNRDGGKAYVIVNGTEYAMDQLIDGIVPDARFEKLLTEADDGITAGTSYTYKFKMDDTEETIDRDPVVAGNYQIFLEHFFNDEGKPVGDIKFICDMRFMAREGLFVPETDYVDIAGDMNGWDGTDYHLTDDNADTIYELLLEELPLETSYNYKYRINGSWDDDKSEFPGGGPNRKATVIDGAREAKSIFNNYRPGYVPVTLTVNMNQYIALGRFDPVLNYVDVAGSMNGWGGDMNDELVVSDVAGVYVTNPPYFAPVGTENDTMYHKFRINSSWDDDKSEFPGGGPNRTFVPVDTTGGVENIVDEVWFNDIPLGINDNAMRFEHISFYPNPVNDVMYIENEVGMHEIRVINIVGQEVYRLNLSNETSYQMNTSELKNGIYILSVTGENGYVGTAKFIKR